jgi:GAF domain-containing protein
MDELQGGLAERLERAQALAGELADGGALAGELAALRAELVRYEAQRYALRCDEQAREQELWRLAAELAKVRRRNSETAGLYVALHRLHASLDHSEVLQAIEDVVSSLLGCKQMAVFELMGTPPLLIPVRVAGLAPGVVESVRPGEGVVGLVAADGELWMASDQPPFFESGRRLNACVPLAVEGAVIGVVALYALYEHRGPLGASDRELLELIGIHAATALYASRLRQRGRAS